VLGTRKGGKCESTWAALREFLPVVFRRGGKGELLHVVILFGSQSTEREGIGKKKKNLAAAPSSLEKKRKKGRENQTPT